MEAPLTPIHPERPREALRAAALTPFTTIDFPGKLSAVVFVQGCPWRCAYCHNPWMQAREPEPGNALVPWSTIENLLSRRRGLLDAVVFSGGEPTVDPALPDAVRFVRSAGFLAGLHTGGAYPARLARVLPMLDWVGLDVKAPPADAGLFDRVAGARGACAHFLEAFRMIRDSGVAFECRTTAHPAWLDGAALEALARWLEAERIDRFALQLYRKPPGLFSRFDAVGADYPPERARAMLKAAAGHYEERRGDQ